MSDEGEGAPRRGNELLRSVSDLTADPPPPSPPGSAGGESNEDIAAWLASLATPAGGSGRRRKRSKGKKKRKKKDKEKKEKKRKTRPNGGRDEKNRRTAGEGDGKPEQCVQFTDLPQLRDTADVSPGQLSSSDRQLSIASTISDASTITASWHDKEFLERAAKSKFEKGLRCASRRNYSLAASKFRSSLKARILLHEDADHPSTAPVQEMLGMVEARGLKRSEKGRAHLRAALEICEGALRALEWDKSEWLLDRTLQGSKDREDDLGEAEGEGGWVIEGMQGLPMPDSLEGEERPRTDPNAEQAPGDDACEKNAGLTTQRQRPEREERGREESSHVGDVDATHQILMTNLARIKRTIEMIDRDIEERKAVDEENRRRDPTRGGLTNNEDRGFTSSPSEEREDGDIEGPSGGEGRTWGLTEAAGRAAHSSEEEPLEEPMEAAPELQRQQDMAQWQSQPPPQKELPQKDESDGGSEEDFDEESVKKESNFDQTTEHFRGLSSLRENASQPVTKSSGPSLEDDDRSTQQGAKLELAPGTIHEGPSFRDVGGADVAPMEEARQQEPCEAGEEFSGEADDESNEESNEKECYAPIPRRRMSILLNLRMDSVAEVARENPESEVEDEDQEQRGAEGTGMTDMRTSMGSCSFDESKDQGWKSTPKDDGASQAEGMGSNMGSENYALQGRRPRRQAIIGQQLPRSLQLHEGQSTHRRVTGEQICDTGDRSMGHGDDDAGLEGENVGMDESSQHKSLEEYDDDPDDIYDHDEEYDDDPDDVYDDDSDDNSDDDSDEDDSFEDFDQEEFENELERRYQVRPKLSGLQSISERSMENARNAEERYEHLSQTKPGDASTSSKSRAHRISMEAALHEWRQSTMPDEVSDDESLDFDADLNGEGTIGVLTLRDRSMMKRISVLSLGSTMSCEDLQSLADPLENSNREQDAFGKLFDLSEEKLRHTFSFQVERGEEHFEAERYSLAKESFNDATLALLVLSEKSAEEYGHDDPDAAACSKLRNDIDLALLWERIADCEAEEVLCGVTSEDHREEGDSSRANYHRSVKMLVDARTGLAEEMRPHSGADAPPGNLKDLEREAVLSLARVYSKQGRVHAKLNNQQVALDSFQKAIASWKAADNSEESPVREVNSTPQYDSDDPLIIETQNEIGSCHNGKRVPFPVTRSLRIATNFDVLTTALEMASYHHGLGYRALEEGNNREAIDHCLCALKLAHEARVACSTRGISSRTKRSSEISVGTAVRIMSWRHGIVSHGRDDGTSMPQCDPKEREESEGSFVKKCALLQTQQEMCISHASFRMGALMLSQKWLLKALASIDDLRLHFDARHDAGVANYVLPLLMRNGSPFSSSEKKEAQSLTGLFSFFQDGVAVAMTMPEGYEEKPRFLIHHALAALDKGLHTDALDMLNRAMTDQFCSSPIPPAYYAKVLCGVDAQIIIQTKQGNTAGVLVTMNRRLDMVSQWIGAYGIERAKDFHRLACFESLFGTHDRCVTCLERALLIGSEYDEFDTLESIKFLATTLEALNDFDGALREYERAVIMEKNVLEKARLMNAMAHLHTKNDARIYLAFDLLDKSLELQEGGDNCKDQEHVELRMETMILYGIAMTMKNCFAKALLWFEAALDSNPNKDPIQPHNLRSWYNKGVTLFRSGDIIGAGHAFGIILDEAERSPAPTRGMPFVLNAIGSIFFVNEDYRGAIECFNRSLQDIRCPLQRAGALCNIAMAYHKMGHYEESESNFVKAMEGSEFAGVDSFELGEFEALRAAIMGKFAYVLFKRKLYLRAYELYSEVAEMGDSIEEQDNGIFGRFESYAEACRLKLVDKNSANALPKPIHEVTPQRPMSEGNLISVKDGHDAARYRDAVFSPKQKFRAALGVEVVDSNVLALSRDDAKIPYGMAVETLMKQSESFRVSYASDFVGLLAKALNSKFVKMESSFGNALTN